ncbi:hypothetical protein ACFXJ5_09245 [Streptomyces sp. NPDC059373]
MLGAQHPRGGRQRRLDEGLGFVGLAGRVEGEREVGMGEQRVRVFGAVVALSLGDH